MSARRPTRREEKIAVLVIAGASKHSAQLRDGAPRATTHGDGVEGASGGRRVA